MHAVIRISLALSLCCVVACTTGDDTSSETSGESSAETSTSASTTATGSETTGDATSDTGGEAFACGELECGGTQVCLTFPQEPDCTDKPDQEPCPPDTTETQCGGAGLPCCCGPTPDPLYECVDPSCGDAPVDCTCLADVCVPSCSATAMANVFICEQLPAP